LHLNEKTILQPSKDIDKEKFKQSSKKRDTPNQNLIEGFVPKPCHLVIVSKANSMIDAPLSSSKLSRTLLEDLRSYKNLSKHLD